MKRYTPLIALPLLIGCFRGIFSEGPRYLATEYVVDKPRIVALRSSPVEMISGTPNTLDALLIAPQNATIESWHVSVCGLDPNTTTQTWIWDLLCFEKDDAITQLFVTPSLPHQFAVPTFPEIDSCNRWNDNNMDTGFTDTGWIEEGYYDNACAHQLPIMIEAIVDGEPVFAAGFTNWYSVIPYHLRRDTTYSDAGIELNIPSQAQAGSEVNLNLNIATNASYATFQWYIDAGVLKDTGITKAHQFQEATESLPHPLTTSNNRLVIPEDYEGILRVWVVVHEPWNSDFDMTWAQGEIEVMR
jgi:hypothetical protein